MTVKTVSHPITERTFRLGRKRPLPGRHKLCFHNYKRAGLPAAPASGHYSYKAESAISQVYLNDQLGDCVIAAPLHAIGTFEGNRGDPITVFTDEQVIALYSRVGGYDPTKTDASGDNPTDQGCDEQTMLGLWQSEGFFGHRIKAWMSVRPEDAKTALWLCESLIFGMELPDAWVNPMPSRNNFVWDVAGNPDPENGHCVEGNSWNANGIMVDTWGMQGLITDAAVAKYACAEGGGELYAPITDEIIVKATQKAPSGFAWSQLVADFNALGATLPA